MQKNRPVITEAKLRRIIRDELARQYLVQEGFLDSLKNPFKKLGEKAKKAILEKTSEVLEKAKKILGTLKDDSVKKFLSAYQSQEGAVPLKELVSSLGLGDAFKELKELGKVDMSKLAKGASVKEGFDVHDFNISMILIEEEHNQKYGSADVLNEVVEVLAIAKIFADAWWATVKGLIGICGTIVLVLKVVGKLCDFLGLTDLKEYVEKAEHAVEYVERVALEKALIPKPAQYAAYRALHALKMGYTKVKGGETHEAITYEQFFSEEGKEERDLAINGLKLAVIAAVIIQEIPHIVHGIKNFVGSLKEASAEASEAAAHLAGNAVSAGKEGIEAASTAAKISKAAEEIGPSAVKAARAAKGA